MVVRVVVWMWSRSRDACVNAIVSKIETRGSGLIIEVAQIVWCEHLRVVVKRAELGERCGSFWRFGRQRAEARAGDGCLARCERTAKARHDRRVNCQESYEPHFPDSREVQNLKSRPSSVGRYRLYRKSRFYWLNKKVKIYRSFRLQGRLFGQEATDMGAPKCKFSKKNRLQALPGPIRFILW